MFRTSSCARVDLTMCRKINGRKKLQEVTFRNATLVLDEITGRPASFFVIDEFDGFQPAYSVLELTAGQSLKANSHSCGPLSLILYLDQTKRQDGVVQLKISFKSKAAIYNRISFEQLFQSFIREEPPHKDSK